MHGPVESVGAISLKNAICLAREISVLSLTKYSNTRGWVELRCCYGRLGHESVQVFTARVS